MHQSGNVDDTWISDLHDVGTSHGLPSPLGNLLGDLLHLRSVDEEGLADIVVTKRLGC